MIKQRLKDSIKIMPNGCWEWQKSCFRYGYGQVKYEGKNWQAHRLSYTVFVGKIPEGLTIDHLCNNRKCINPNHLEPVTIQENIKRRIHGNSKLTHCKRGHLLPEKRNNQGQRYCQQCDTLRHQERRVNI